MDCDENFYDTSYIKAFYQRPGNNFAPLAPHIPEKDPNIIPGHFANNLLISGNPIESKTWEKFQLENNPEEYREFLKRLKTKNKFVYEKYFSNPPVNFDILDDFTKDDKLTTYQSIYTPDEYVSRKDGLKWPRSKLDTSKYLYHEATYNTYYDRIVEIGEMRQLAKPFTWQHDVETLKGELRKIYKSTKSTYYRHYCEPRLPKLNRLHKQGKLWDDPLDPYTLRVV